MLKNCSVKTNLNNGYCKQYLFYTNINIIVILLSILVFNFNVTSTSAGLQGETIDRWAQTFGNELWELGNTITKADEIKARYTSYNAQIEKKNVTKLLKSVVENVSRMLSRKMDAIKCILNASEEIALRYERPEDLFYRFPENGTINTENITYYSSKYSPVINDDAVDSLDYYQPELPEIIEKNKNMYLLMDLNPDTNFYNIPVNTSHSSVHVPTNVYDLYENVLDTIEWSKELDSTFTQNYKSDPALSWQYFCSANGVLRHFPAMQWNQNNVDLYDCRKRSWYIEAATCSKDVIILLDISGSMRGHNNWIAGLTVSSILDTLSNNDYVNIFSFNNDTYDLIDCYSDRLIQATFENINHLKDAVKSITKTDLNSTTNFQIAFQKAFEILKEYREMRNCNNEQNNNLQSCNQLIMLITDGVPSNLTEIYSIYNRVHYNASADNMTADTMNTTTSNNTNYMSLIPVRIFTYLIGKEVTKVREIQWLACLNRGYYVHIEDLEEVDEQVLKYIPVIARPLVLQGIEHPTTWTHAFVDLTSEDDEDEGDYRLLTSVTIPVYDKKMNSDNETTRADLLGIAGTDVPLEDIEKLTLPYKLGVNAYSFVVSNNGYLLKHPDLRPFYQGVLKENYNSIDLMEVEQVDDHNNLGVRELNNITLKLRESLVNHEFGNIMDVPIKYHWDKMRRIHEQSMDYYFAPLHNTPFSIGLAIPNNYGDMWIKVGDELKKNLHMGQDITKFFNTNLNNNTNVNINWRVHPEWVYCKYHYVEGHEFNSSESELIHFLKKMSNDLPNWKWSEQYEADPLLDDISWGPNGTLAESREFNCGRKTLNDDDYYCNKELVQRLVFDAKVTEPFLYDNFDTLNTTSDNQLYKLYNVYLRFIATMSGLTRWQYMKNQDKHTRKEFGNVHPKSIDETWYKSAVFQHEIDDNSYILSVPFQEPTTSPKNSYNKNDKTKLLVTASHAIFPRDGGNEAPGSVVGFQFELSKMYERFMEITSRVICQTDTVNKVNKCSEKCQGDKLDCYVIDSNGYVVLSEQMSDVGRFFGEIEGAVMETMINLNIYKKITIYDYQGLCFFEHSYFDDASTNTFHILSSVFNMIKLFVTRIVYTLLETNLYQLWNSVSASIEEILPSTLPTQEYVSACAKPENWSQMVVPKKKLRKGQNQEEEDFFNKPRELICERKHRACDKQIDLYILQQKKFIDGDIRYNGKVPTTCSRPFYIKRIVHTNLLLVVVDGMKPTCYTKIFALPRDIIYDNYTQPPCHKLALNDLPRRRLAGCYTEHPLEEQVEACGDASSIVVNTSIQLLLFIYILFIADTGRGQYSSAR
ncbi:voltage-dependent calcium channel subunit alpha-2/delta-3 [Chrysoperla carnea]|uniref:voltage-dependent calcium channel subunit alpha-2/delta-3 n=1 Tax=Chrysoperla carnea TaxID=189513 RepID=UPI001D088C6F|nr:voltage-dependent calcium channel subunit alpha-2/delta-3 [Chrysoperla carnea]